MEELNEYLNETPIVVKFWETELDRDEGLSEIYGYYPESQKAEAIQAGKKLMHRMDYACVEVYNEETEETYYWTDGVTEDYFDNNLTEAVDDYKEGAELRLEYWKTKADRDEGFGEIYKYYPESHKKEAILKAKDLMRIYKYACVEVYNTKTERTEYWTDGKEEKYYANKDIFESLNIDAPVNFEYGKYKGIIEPNGDVTYNKGTSKNNTRYKFNYNDKSIESDFPHTDNQVVRNYIKTNILNEYAKKITEDTQEDIIAKKYGLTPYLNKLTHDLMNLQYVTKVDYDLYGYYNGIYAPVTLVSYDIDVTDEEFSVTNYMKAEEKLVKQILDVMKSNGVNVELEEFEDNDTYFYIVAYSTNWNTVVKEEEAVNTKTKLTFAYKDNGQFYYKDKNGKVYVDMSPLKDKIALYRCVGDYDEPANSVNVEEYELINNPKDNINYDRNKNYEFDYMLLDRLVQDCKYYLGNGNRFDGNLWAGSVDKQIAKMKELWNKFPEDMKPEWLSMEDIENYEKEMTAEKKTERRVLGEYKSIKNEDIESANKEEIQLYYKFMNEIREELDIKWYDVLKEGNAIKFFYKDEVYYAEPVSTFQVDIYDKNHKKLTSGVAIDKLKEEVFTEYDNDDFLYELVGGEYAGTYTGDEARKLPILEPELSPDGSDIRANGGLTHRKELDKQLQFKGYLGPMWNGTKDGKAIIRYETQEVYNMLSENKLVEETDKEMYKRIKDEPREEQSMRDRIELNMITHTIEDKCVYDVCDYGKAKAYKEMGY